MTFGQSTPAVEALTGNGITAGLTALAAVIYNPPAMSYELVVRGGTVVTDTASTRVDVGVDGGRIAALAPSLPAGRRGPGERAARRRRSGHH